MNPARPRAFSLLVLALSMGAGCVAQAAQLVKVGAVHFPPYVVRPEQGDDTGLLPQLIEALNADQQQYHFELVPTSIPRRFNDFTEKRIDIVVFENPDWDWKEKGIPFTPVDMGLEDAEIFVARAEKDRDQSYFTKLEGKRLALFSGYHYEFANFNADPRYLKETWNAALTYSHDSNLAMVERGRADIALVTRSYVEDFIKRNPEDGRELLRSERTDQIYHHYALLRPQAPISGADFAQLLDDLRGNGQLQKIFQPYRITVMPAVKSKTPR